jgi:hypothetical protein
MTPALFCLSYFSDRVLCFCLGLALHHNPPIYASQVAWITVPPHPVCWDGVLLTFCPGWPWTVILPNSVSQVTGIMVCTAMPSNFHSLNWNFFWDICSCKR